ncbi:hypothetical protein EDB85DRAFT_2222292 [Lactarius pseudohatsudake]|nr:hypothetical protein EDB85DRAFT_2222292 [Lactarius pseudohatsudake]
MPPAFEFTRFLVSSITFMAHLSEVSIYFDDQRLVRLSKRGDEPVEVPMLAGLDSKTPDGRMTVRSVQTVRLHIEAEVARSVYTVGSEKRLARRTDTSKVLSSKKKAGGFLSLFSGPSRRPSTPAPATLKQPINLLGALSSSVVLTTFTANVDVRLDKKMTAELLASNEEDPSQPFTWKRTNMTQALRRRREQLMPLGVSFEGLGPDLEGQVASTGSARVFIGHSTGQTTGIGGHMATRFIPTVEREAIDLGVRPSLVHISSLTKNLMHSSDRNVAVWNKGLLHVGGFLARFAYEHEMEIIKKEWDAAVAADSPGGLPDTGLQAWLRARALHALKFFTFRPSTPSPVVSTSMQAAFFACATARPFSIISSEGVRSSSLVYIPHPDFSGFLKRLPVISEDVVNGANITIAALRARKMIKNIEFEDVLNELRSRPLSETETVACLKWWIDKGGKNNNLQRRSQLLDALVVSINGPPERIMKFSDARTFLNATTGGGIPADGPLPSTLLPTSVTGSFDPDVLGTVFPWKQLTIVEWLRHIADPKVAAVNAEFDITLSVSWAERVLSVLARAWPSLPESAKEDIIKILKPMPCVPTSAGLKVPDQAYFASANLNMFSDLPIVALPSDASIKETLETVLQSLGVHKHADLQIIFERMIRTGDWTIPEFVKYLVSIQSDLTLRVLKDLRGMTAFPKEGTDKEPSAATTSSEVQLQRYKIMDLYEPVDIFRELGLPIIDWGVDNTWERTSDEAKFLFSLGLKRFLPLSELLNITASNNQTVREKALTFFLDNLSVKYSDYDPNNYQDLAFVPALRGSEKVLAKPFELYASPKWATLGFLVVDPLFRGDAARKLKLNSHPPTSKIMTLLKTSPPIDETTARQWFEVLSDHVRVFSLEELRKLSETPFVPIQSTGDNGVVQRSSPRGCYFSGIGVAELHAKLFPFVDFGERANEFLAACGTKKEPSVEEIAQILLADPRKFHELANGREHYLVELRNIASTVLLGLRRVKRSGGRSSNEDDEDHWVLQDDLLLPNNVAIADDTDAYQLFGDRIFCAPQEDVLEELYLFLGSPRLTSLVREDCKPAVEIPSSTIGPEIRRLILERLPLLLHGHPQPLTEVKTKVSFDWLNEDMNFVVKVFENLQFTTSLQHGDVRHAETREASAFAKRDSQGPIELWLAGNTPVDMHEVSTSLSRFIFESPRANDIITFMTILSTNIETLKRWGYNVNRILRRQKDERKAAKSAETVTPPFPNDLPYQGSKIVTLLERSPPIDETTARQWFEVLSDRVRVFSPEDLRRLSETPFVPVKSTGSEGVIQRLSPKRCYFAGIDVAKLHAKHFSVIDFGARAKKFLEACGVQYRPSVEEIAQILLVDPRKFYELANGREHYLVELRNFAEYRWSLAKETIDRMKQSNVLLGSRRVRGSGGEGHWVLQDDLLQPNKVAIADDTDAYQLFGGHIFCAPQENILEELYLLLGSPRLTSLIKEDCKATIEIPSSTIGPEIRRLILERLPLFFHGHPQSRTNVKTKVSFNWLNKDMNFAVKVFENLQLTMSLQHGDVRHFETREVSAFARRDAQGPIELWLAGNIPVDMHEVSASLSRFIFESPRTVDIFLFATILSIDMETQVETLKRRGYNVDGILRQQKAERKAYEASKGQDLDSSNSSGPNVTPLSTIDNNIEMAIGACVPVGSNQPRIREEIQIVRESLHTGCYDVSDRGGKFKLVGSIGGVKVFAAEDFPESESIVQRKHDVLTRFLLVLNPLVAIYKIPQSSLNILAADDGLIAFNRNGSLFMNLRYFEAWHDHDVQRADFSKAYISWYLTLAHEIAHNLVRTHDSVHEFYFSAICGAYFAALSKLLR